MNDAPNSVRVGTALGPYLLEKLIAKGGMGAVYRACHLTDGRRVAVKVLHPDALRREEVRQRFQREWAILKVIKHPNVVRLIDLPTPDPKEAPHYVMELCIGDTLHERLAKQGAMPIDEALTLFSELASGLTAVHEAGVIHRDIKPTNVILQRSITPPFFVTKILDFGFARVGGSQLTTMGLVLGTPAYASPEQASGDPVDVRSDVYSLGLLMYRALTDQHPFGSEDPVELLGHQLLSTPPPLSWIRDDIPKGLEALVMAMLRKDPACRPGSMAEIEASLKHIRAAPDGDKEESDVAENPAGEAYEPKNPIAGSVLRGVLVARGFVWPFP